MNQKEKRPYRSTIDTFYWFDLIVALLADRVNLIVNQNENRGKLPRSSIWIKSALKISDRIGNSGVFLHFIAVPILDRAVYLLRVVHILII